MRTAPSLPIALVALLSVRAAAQDAPAPAEPVAAVLERWDAAYRSGRLRGAGAVAARDVDIYGPLVAAGGPHAAAVDRVSHVAVLRDLLDVARRAGDPRSARAVLGIAAAGHARRLTDAEALEIRELGHWTLMRMATDPAVRELVCRAAAGDPEVLGVGAEPQGRPGPAAERAVAMRVAALKALGLARDDAARAVIEARLADPDERIRLAAAEALGRMRDRDAVDLLVRAARTETHPVVAQALVVALDRTLAAHRDDPPPALRGRMTRTVLARLGHTGWRTDLALVELAEHNPDLASIPALIRVLEGFGTEDPLLRAVNADASPILRRRAWHALRRLTGTIRPLEDPQAWWEFWENERDRLVLPRDPVRSDARVTTSAGFFGIPVEGREVAFVIDTSGSMDEEMRWQDERGRPVRGSRLDVARRELLRAVHAMPAESRYHLLTFAGQALRWNERPVPPREDSYRALTECVGRFEAHGGTNLFDALMQVLGRPDGAPPDTDVLDCDEVFVLTDGEPTVGLVRDPDAIVGVVEEVNRYRRARIHTVHVGGEKGADLMRRLAEGNDGVAVQR